MEEDLTLRCVTGGFDFLVTKGRLQISPLLFLVINANLQGFGLVLIVTHRWTWLIDVSPACRCGSWILREALSPYSDTFASEHGRNLKTLLAVGSFLQT